MRRRPLARASALMATALACWTACLARRGLADAAPPKTCYDSPYMGLFAQEHPASALPPGVTQHRAFGAVLPWSRIHATLAACGGACRLLLLVRHGEATSNVVQAAVGGPAWNQRVAKKCSFRGAPLWDAPLTAKGAAQAQDLAHDLAHGPAGARLADLLGPAAARPRAVSSPLRRALNTTLLALGGGGGAVPLAGLAVSELARERWGVNTCDGRHPVTFRPGAGGGGGGVGADVDGHDGPDAVDHPTRPPCEVGEGLRDLFGPQAFGGWPIVGDLVPPVPADDDDGDEGGGSGGTCAAGGGPPGPLRFGLLADGDVLWTPRARESASHVEARARVFLDTIWAETAPDGPAGSAMFVVAHSGFIAYLLDAVGRPVYHAANTEVVPVLVRRREGAGCDGVEDDGFDLPDA